MGKTKFQSSWKKDRPSVVHVKNNVDEAMCRVCGDHLNVTSGTGVTKTHEKRSKQWNNLEKSKNQLYFVVNKKGSLSLKLLNGAREGTLSETLLVGRCSALDMLNNLKTFIAKQNLDIKLLLNLGMDGPGVNVAFQNLLIKWLKEKYHTTFIDLGTCSLHSANNGFSKLVKELDEIVELDQMVIDLLFFFKYLTCRREDFAKVSEITGIYEGIWRNIELLDRSA